MNKNIITENYMRDHKEYMLRVMSGHILGTRNYLGEDVITSFRMERLNPIHYNFLMNTFNNLNSEMPEYILDRALEIIFDKLLGKGTYIYFIFSILNTIRLKLVMAVKNEKKLRIGVENDINNYINFLPSSINEANTLLLRLYLLAYKLDEDILVKSKYDRNTATEEAERVLTEYCEYKNSYKFNFTTDHVKNNSRLRVALIGHLISQIPDFDHFELTSLIISPLNKKDMERLLIKINYLYNEYPTTSKVLERRIK